MTTTTTLTAGQSVAEPTKPSLLRIYLLEAGLEFLKLWRMPAFSVPTLVFPVLFYVFFGLTLQSPGSFSMATYLMATYGAFGVIGASLFGFGVGVAVERGQGWMLLKRASPMPPGAYFAAKIAMSVLFGSLIITMLYVLGGVFGGAELRAAEWALLAAVHLFGALPFCAMGLAMGYFAGPNSAPAIVNIVYLPMAFLSGLWIPVQVLPEVVQGIARFLPAYHFGQLALKVIGADQGRATSEHVIYLVVLTVVSLLLARVGLRRDSDQTFG